MNSLCIYADLHETVKNVKAINIATDIQQCVPFALFPSYRIFKAAANNMNVLTNSCKVPEIVVRF